MIDSIFVVYMAKSAMKNISILDGPIGAFANMLVSTTLLDPTVRECCRCIVFVAGAFWYHFTSFGFTLLYTMVLAPLL